MKWWFMPQKVKSVTISSKFNTGKAAPATRSGKAAPAEAAQTVKTTTVGIQSKSGDAAATAIQWVKGVGPRMGMIFESRGVSTVRDLLFFFPRAYEDRTKLLRVAE